MFRSIVSRLSFSPALVGQLSFYAKRLRKEQVTRRLGLIFTALALVVQSLAVFQPPEPANAASHNDIVYGGVKTLDQFLNLYDKNSQNLRDIMNAFGITRKEIAATKYTVFTVGKKYSWGRHARSIDVGSKEIYNSKGQHVETIYGRPMSKQYKRGEASREIAFTGYSKKQGWFGIILDCGNLVTDNVPPPPPPKKIKVCRLSDSKIVTIKESNFDKRKHSKNLNDCKPKKIKVCELATFKVITISEDKFDKKKHSKDTKNCKPKKIKVCELATLKVITIDENKFDKKKHSKNTKDCSPTMIKVCHLPDSRIITIDEKKFDKSIHSKNLNDCNPKDITVCDLTTSEVITIREDKFDPLVHSRDLGDCEEEPGRFDLSKSASNLTQGNVDATTTLAKSDDRITYTLAIHNSGGMPIEASFEDNLYDVLEYATLIDTGGGTYNKSTGSISWPETTIEPDATEYRKYTVRLLSTIPSTPIGVSDLTSYDCSIDNVFGNGVAIDVDCPTPKVVESVVEELPQTGPGENIAFAAIVFSVVTFFYYRSKQLNKEVRLIRRNLNAGAL